MATQSEIGTWQQIAAWEKSVGSERNIAPPPPKLKSVIRAEKPGEEPNGDLRRSSPRP
jgi:hypothetical protein